MLGLFSLILTGRDLLFVSILLAVDCTVPEYILRNCSYIDYVIRGEGELSLLELVHSIYNNKETKDINGVCLIDKNNNFIDNGLSKRIEYIDEIPRPAWHLLKVKNYFNDYFTSGLARGRNMAILATRGCPYQCTFCSSPSMWTTRYVMRDPKDLADEMEWLIEEFGATSFEFYDLFGNLVGVIIVIIIFYFFKKNENFKN